MKRLFIIPLLLTQVISGTLEDKLFNAISESRVTLIGKILKKMDNLDPKKKNDYLEAAKEVLDERKTVNSLFRSWPDLAKFVGGMSLMGLAAVGGVVTFARCVDDRCDNPKLIGAAGGGLSVTSLLVGGYLAMNGWVLQSAHGKRMVARKVVDLIEKAPVIEEPAN